MYRVVSMFRDLEDEHLYQAGDVFPHDGRDVSPARIQSLITGDNMAHMRLIEKDEEEPKPEQKTRRRAAKTRKQGAIE